VCTDLRVMIDIIAVTSGQRVMFTENPIPTILENIALDCIANGNRIGPSSKEGTVEKFAGTAIAVGDR